MSESKKPSNFFKDMRCVPVNPARQVLPSMPASVPAGMANHASAGLGIPLRFWLFGTRFRSGSACQKKPAAHKEVAGAGLGPRTDGSCVRPGHIGGGGGPLAETSLG